MSVPHQKVRTVPLQLYHTATVTAAVILQTVPQTIINKGTARFARLLNCNCLLLASTTPVFLSDFRFSLVLNS